MLAVLSVRLLCLQAVTDWAARRPGAQLVLFSVYTTPYWSTLVALAQAETTTDATKIIWCAHKFPT